MANRKGNASVLPGPLSNSLPNLESHMAREGNKALRNPQERSHCIGFGFEFFPDLPGSWRLPNPVTPIKIS